jgi:hypothetical protein
MGIMPISAAHAQPSFPRRLNIMTGPGVQSAAAAAKAAENAADDGRAHGGRD